jgi:hypothetical protein
MLYQNPAIQSRVEVHLVEEAKGGPSKLLLSFLFAIVGYPALLLFFVRDHTADLRLMHGLMSP